MLRPMKLRTGVGILAIAAAIAACKKVPEGGAGSVTGSGSAAAGSSRGSGSAAGSSAAGSGSGAGASAAGSGSATGAGSGSATGAGSGSTAADGADSANPGYNKAAFLQDPLCLQVADKIRACADQPEFITALDGGATAAQKKINARLRKGVKKWQSSYELCHNAWDILNYEYTGFLDKPAALKAPSALASCAELGAAVKAAGGLVGGKTGE
jgi:hypothetical protein